MKHAPITAASLDRDGVVHVSGALTIFTATQLLYSAGKLFDERGGTLVFDLAGLEHCDSAALAVLLEWTRRAARAERKLAYRNAPERLRQLARISELESVLPIEGSV